MQVVKELLSIIRDSFKTANKKVYLIAGSIGVVTGIIMGGAVLMGNAAQADLAGAKKTHANCIIAEKHVKMYFTGRTSMISGWEANTSCGTFDVVSSLYDSLSEGQSYNLAVTAGNWANKPTVTSAEVAGK